MKSLRVGLPLMLALALGAGGARAQAEDSARSRLKQVESSIAEAEKRKAALQKEAEKLAADINVTARDMVALATAIQQRERSLTQIEQRLAKLTAERDAQLQALAVRQRDAAQLLAALQSMSNRPRALMLLRPGSAVETVRSANVMMAVLPALQERTAQLRRQLAELGQTQRELAAEQKTYGEELAGLKADHEKLNALRATREKERAGLLAQAKLQSTQLEKMASEAKDIKDLLARLEAEARKRERLARLPAPRLRPADLAARSRSKAETAAAASAPPAQRRPRAAPSSPAVALTPPVSVKGGFRMPVQGAVTRRFGAATEGGGSSKGILIRTRREAQVVAPFSGRVVFAGPFRGYGQLLIIAHGNGYHSLLAGMARIDEKVGASVQAGEPIGAMSATDQQDPELYLELRQRGTPIDPLPWLRGERGRSDG